MMSTFASRLRRAMIQANLTQKELAARCGLSKAAVSQYLSGKHTPGDRVMDLLAEATGTTKAYLCANTPKTAEEHVAYPVTNISPAMAARCMGKSPQFVRVGLQRGILPFGSAVPVRGHRMTYYINPERFRAYVSPERFDAFFGAGGGDNQ